MACGTVRANRKGLHTTLLAKNVPLQQGELKLAQKDDHAYAIWMDTKVVLTLSNFHDPTQQGMVLRRRDGVRTQVPGPKMLQDYHQHMRGVDLLDQAISYHTVNHRSRKWGKSLLLWCWHIIPMLLQRIRLMRAIDSGGQPSSTSWRAWGVILSETQGQREPRQPECPLQTHTLERMFAKRRVCRECAFSMLAGE